MSKCDSGTLMSYGSWAIYTLILGVLRFSNSAYLALDWKSFWEVPNRTVAAEPCVKFINYVSADFLHLFPVMEVINKLVLVPDLRLHQPPAMGLRPNNCTSLIHDSLISSLRLWLLTNIWRGKYRRRYITSIFETNPEAAFLLHNINSPCHLHCLTVSFSDSCSLLCITTQA